MGDKRNRRDVGGISRTSWIFSSGSSFDMMFEVHILGFGLSKT